jgi:hypothetical protein
MYRRESYLKHKVFGVRSPKRRAIRTSFLVEVGGGHWFGSSLRAILSTSPEFKRIGSGVGGLRSGCLIIFWSVFARLSRQANKRPIRLPARFAGWLMARPRPVVRLSGRWPQRPIAGYRDQIINTGQ